MPADVVCISKISEKSSFLCKFPWSRMMKMFGLGQMDQNGIFGIGIEMNLTILEAEIEKEFS